MISLLRNSPKKQKNRAKFRKRKYTGRTRGRARARETKPECEAPKYNSASESNRGRQMRKATRIRANRRRIPKGGIAGRHAVDDSTAARDRAALVERGLKYLSCTFFLQAGREWRLLPPRYVE